MKYGGERLTMCLAIHIVIPQKCIYATSHSACFAKGKWLNAFLDLGEPPPDSFSGAENLTDTCELSKNGYFAQNETAGTMLPKRTDEALRYDAASQFL
jgi:hypothetical protein